MMKIMTGVSEDGIFHVTIKSPLVAKYFTQLKGMCLNEEGIPSGMSVEKENSETALIEFPVTIISNNGNGTVGVPKEVQTHVSNVINLAKRFTIAAIKYQLKRSEFIPLRGYALSDLKNDVQAAIKAKRNFVILDTYKNYLEQHENQTYEFNQYVVEYGTHEYSEVALMIVSEGNMSELRRLYENKLTKTSWI